VNSTADGDDAAVPTGDQSMTNTIVKQMALTNAVAARARFADVVGCTHGFPTPPRRLHEPPGF